MGTVSFCYMIISDQSYFLLNSSSWFEFSPTSYRKKTKTTSTIPSQSQSHRSTSTMNTIRVNEDELGYINNIGQLIVNVNETYLLWTEGQERLCKLLRDMTALQNNTTEATTTTNDDPIPSPTTINITMDCNDEKNSIFGQGNWVSCVYAARMASYFFGVNFKFQCADGQQSKMELLLPWFDSYQPAYNNNNNKNYKNKINPSSSKSNLDLDWPYGGGIRPSERQVCARLNQTIRIDKMALQIQDDLRKMAVSLVGTRNDGLRFHPNVSPTEKPLIPDIELDDVAIHLRCGDVMGGYSEKKNIGNNYGMIQFAEYKKWIPHTAQTIGIVTEPFDKIRISKYDNRKLEQCKQVVYALVKYLHDDVVGDDVKISIRNDINETLPLAYARLVMADVSITSLSTFGLFPVIGTFGQGYFQKGKVNPWAPYITDILNNIHEMNAKVRTTAQMKGKSTQNLIDWFLDNVTTTPTKQPKLRTGYTKEQIQNYMKRNPSLLKELGLE